MSADDNNSLIEYEEINNDEEYDSILKIDEFFIFQDGMIYKFFLNELDNKISIRYKKYEKKINLNEFISKTKIEFRTIQESYKYMSKLFEENKVKIKSINTNRSIILSFDLSNNVEQEKVEFNLIYKENQSNSLLEEINNKYNNLLKNITSLKNEIKRLKKEQKDCKIYDYQNPKDLKFVQDMASD